MMITKFHIFESTMMDVVKSKDPFILSYMQSHSNFEYGNLPSSIYIDFFEKNIKVDWNDTPRHDFKERIKRYNFKSVNDFVEIFKKSLSNVFPKLTKGNKYCIRLLNKKIYIFFDYKNVALFGSGQSPIFVVTLLPHPPIQDVEILDVDDTYFLKGKYQTADYV